MHLTAHQQNRAQKQKVSRMINLLKKEMVEVLIEPATFHSERSALPGLSHTPTFTRQKKMKDSSSLARTIFVKAGPKGCARSRHLF